MKILIILCCVHASLAASIGTGASCPLFCTEQYSPVCGSDGKTYGNQCFFHIGQCHDASLTMSHVGRCSSGVTVPALKPCQNVMCITLWDPVCGSDGVTYSNTCRLGAANCGTHSVTLTHKGPCGGGSGTITG